MSQNNLTDTPGDTDRVDAVRASAALERLAALHPKLIDLGLDRTFALLDRLGNPHHNLPPTIHVSGTNGKGSTIALMRAVAESAGMRVHVYSSPHLCHFNERIRLAGSYISDGALADLLEEVEQRNNGEAVTFFEVTTAAAMLAFSRVSADLLLLETGLGGELDSTNVLDRPAATVITPIARDHEHFLGSDLAGIARAKAGIMRRNVPCFSAVQLPAVESTLRDAANNLDTKIEFFGQDFTLLKDAKGGLELLASGASISLPTPSLRGAHQIENAALACHALAHIFPNTAPQELVKGIASAEWPGRVQRLDHGDLVTINNGREIWLDGAHNAHGATALAAALSEIDAGPWVVICGALNTRDPKDFLEPVLTMATSVHCLTIPDQDASLSGEEMAVAAQALGLAATAHDSIEQAIRHINENAELASLPLVICGSLYLAGHVLLANKTPPR